MHELETGVFSDPDNENSFPELWDAIIRKVVQLGLHIISRGYAFEVLNNRFDCFATISSKQALNVLRYERPRFLCIDKVTKVLIEVSSFAIEARLLPNIGKILTRKTPYDNVSLRN